MEFDYRDEDSNHEKAVSAIFQALGAASVCWEFPERAGVFDSTRAKQIGEALVEEQERFGL